MTTIKQRPLVPSSLGNPGQGSGQTSDQTGGAKNPWVRTGCQLYIATYNARSIGNEERLTELEYELNKINWDILGIAETRRKGEECITLKTGHVLLNKGDEDRGMWGVGILIHKKWVPYISKMQIISDRIIYITLKINSKITLKFIQIYAPTSKQEDEEIEVLYEDLTKSIKEHKTTYTIVGGDFNAKIGTKIGSLDPEHYIGKFGLGTRNKRGDMLANFAECEKLYLMNTFFKKKDSRRWTWVSPSGEIKNEIDFILSTHKNIVQDVNVLNSFSTGSDHRMVRSKIKINVQLERAKTFKNKTGTIDRILLQSKKEEYRKQLSRNFERHPGQNNENIDEANTRIGNIIRETSEKVAKNKRVKPDKFSQKTKNLLEKRRDLIKAGKRNTIEYAENNKAARKSAKIDILEYDTLQIETLIENNRGLKVFRRNESQRKEMYKLKDKQGNIITDRKCMLEITELFYADLYKSKVSDEVNPQTKEKGRIINVNSEELPDIEIEEIELALKQMKHGKAGGDDNILPEMLKECEERTKQELQKLFNECLIQGKIPTEWENSITILIFKKGDPTDLENYRPISLLSQVYKLFMRIVTNRLERKLEIYQPTEQAGFRKEYSTIEHLHTVRQLTEKSIEYNLDIWMAFIDFKKAFDTVETWAIIKAMRNARIDQRYIDLIEYIYNKATMRIKTHETTEKIKIQRGVRQGDIISPKLFTLVLEDVFKNLHWEQRGVTIQGEKLNNLRFADDIILFAQDKAELKKMLEELNLEAKKIGLEMNTNKTKIMTNQQTNSNTLTIEEKRINIVDVYVYLGQEITLKKDSQDSEIKRRIRLSWAAYGKLNYVMKMKLPTRLKTKIYNECILPVATYGCETWVLNKRTLNAMQVHQRAIERRILGISLRDRKTNKWIRQRTKVSDITQRICSLKWRWAGHVARHSDKWSGKITRWRPWGERRSVGRPPQRWYDDLKRYAGLNWYQKAQNRENWKDMKEAYIESMEKG